MRPATHASSRLLPNLLVVPLLFGCATDISSRDLTVTERLHDGAPFGTVSVLAIGISQGRYYPLPEARLKEAVEQSVKEAGLLTPVDSSTNSDYSVEVRVVDLPDPKGGMTMTVNAIFGWSLRKGHDDAPLLEDLVETSCTTTTDDSVLGPNRGKLAIVGAVQANMRIGMARISAVLSKQRDETASRP